MSRVFIHLFTQWKQQQQQNPNLSCHHARHNAKLLPFFLCAHLPFDNKEKFFGAIFTNMSFCCWCCCCFHRQPCFLSWNLQTLQVNSETHGLFGFYSVFVVVLVWKTLLLMDDTSRNGWMIRWSCRTVRCRDATKTHKKTPPNNIGNGKQHSKITNKQFSSVFVLAVASI